ncbi:Cytochrome p460 [hydrothermal vent metagenome]|uniref:Cytochrome p460 n=1 Tax=hydrothermal vent metagenome TaxID=652676 RepID=A0A3B0X8X6_9ZZZZ
MKFTKLSQTICLILLSGLTAQNTLAGQKVKPSPNGIELPEGYKDWKVISQSHRTDNNTVRIILGNDIAVKAARAGKTRPWPKGSVLGKMVWKQKAEEHWPAAIAPDKFVHAEFMFKDSEKYKSTGGWGYARWKGMDQKPHGKDKNFAQECVTCHTPVKDNDWVFTTPAIMP